MAQEGTVTVKPKKEKPDASLLMWMHLTEIHQKGYKAGLTTHVFPSIFREHKFCETRKWRFDFAINSEIGIEIDGGSWINGRHNTGSGSAKDREKFNYATLLGWRVLKFTPAEVLDGTAIAFIKRVLER